MGFSPSPYAPHEGKEVGKSKAFLIGIAQASPCFQAFLAQADHRWALLLGVDKKKAARFSFLMVLIPIIGANAKDILDGGWPAAVYPPYLY